MATQSRLDWGTLSAEIREVLRWAAACEIQSPDVGTRALLVGILRSKPGRSTAEDLLRHFGLARAELFEAVRGGDFEIEPNVSAPAKLSKMPPLTDNAQRCLSVAADLQRENKRSDLDLTCLFGAILESDGTARSGLATVLEPYSIDEISRHYLDWLRNPTLDYRQALGERFPADPPTVRASVAATGTPVSIGSSSGAGNDLVAGTDRLGFSVYVQAFADLIMSVHTQPPLTIGIFGSWGMGKSFLLEHIRRVIEQRQAERTTPGPRIHPVSFNAWEYSATDAIWPALVRKIVRELDQLHSWPWRKRVWTRLRWNLRREWRSLRTKVVTCVLALGCATAFVVGDSGVIAAVVTGVTALGLGGLVKAANDPIGKWITRLFADSDYGGQIQLMEDVKHDLDVLERRLHGTDSSGADRVVGRILVVIDDLDRCEPAKAVEVLQAVNLLLNFSSFIVCLGIDARIVTAAIEKHYEGLLGAAGASGYEYLDKIVQIPFRIPDPSPSEIGVFLRGHLGPVQSSETGSTTTTSGEPAWSGRAATNGRGPRTPVRVVRAATHIDPVDSDVPFTSDEQQAFELFADYLRPNPRHLKRLINLYRLIRTLGSAEREPLVLERPAAVLRWLIMWSQWPYTSLVLLREFDRLGLARAGRQEPDPMRYLLDRVPGSIDEAVRRQHDYDPEKLRGLLAVQGCRLSAAEIQRIRRYTVNFNPAVEERWASASHS